MVNWVELGNIQRSGVVENLIKLAADDAVRRRFKCAFSSSLVREFPETYGKDCGSYESRIMDVHGMRHAKVFCTVIRLQ